jgi:hypothetical protein
MLEIADGSALDSNTSLTFAGSGGFLQIDDTTMPTATIYGLGNGDAIGLADVQPGLSPTITLLLNHVLQVSIITGPAAGEYDFQLDPNQDFTGYQFDLVNFAPAGAVFAFEASIVVMRPTPTATAAR